jgi:iron(III) transport system ATP-binding protein
MTVTLDQVSKRFGSTVVIDNLSATFRAGAISVLLGASGCGKTTTLRCIAGLETPDEGRISIAELDVFWRAGGVSLAPERREIAMVFQSYAIWPHMTVRENVGLPLRARGVDAAESAKAIGRALDLVGLSDFGARMATQLSGGQQQRVALARSIVRPSRVILLDEPLSNLDAKLRTAMRQELKALQRELGTTMIFVTHDQEEAMSLGDEVFVFHEGRILQRGEPQEVYHRPASRYVAEFFGKANFIAAAATPTGAGRLGLRTEQGELAVIDTPGDVLAGPVVCVIRPEAWRIAGTADGGGAGLRGRVRERTFIGDRQEFVIETALGAQAVVTLGFHSVNVGDDVQLVVDPRRIHLLAGSA